MNHELAFVSGSDVTYFPLLRGLVRALRETRGIVPAPIYIFDAGLAPEQRDWLAGRGAILLKPEWSLPRSVPGYVAMLAARPSIPDYFPGHRAYIWLDADAWPQQAEAIDTYRRAALDKGFAVTPETHPAYNMRELGEAHRRIRGWFGAEVQAKLEGTAPINLGVFAGAAGAPHWPVWRGLVDRWLAAATKPEIDFNADQTAFNVIAHVDKISTEFLPARYNWICHTSTPMVSEDGAILLEPVPPYKPLSVIHITLWTKKGPQKLKTPSGREIARPLTFSAEALPEDGKALPDFALKDL